MWLSKPMRRPVPLACSATALAALFLGAGVSGRTLSRHEAFVAGTAWTGGVVWWQVGVGVALRGMSVWLWRRAIRSLHA
jgi:membrane protein implicated in regulation of membrane protease activity